jgi:hypothetical protein
MLHLFLLLVPVVLGLVSVVAGAVTLALRLAS